MTITSGPIEYEPGQTELFLRLVINREFPRGIEALFASVAEHLYDTWNDDGSLLAVQRISIDFNVEREAGP